MEFKEDKWAKYKKRKLSAVYTGLMYNYCFHFVTVEKVDLQRDGIIKKELWKRSQATWLLSEERFKSGCFVASVCILIILEVDHYGN